MSPKWKPYAAVLLPCMLILLILQAVLRRDPTARNVEIFTEMAYSRAYESLSRSPELPHGSTQQPLAEGVVLRGSLPFRFGAGPEEALRAGHELENPSSGDPADLARGGQLYQRFCAVCHGGDGAGGGSVVLRGMLPPPSLLAARASQMKDGEMFHILTKGQGIMASYAAQIAPEDRWKVIGYVRSLQGGGQ